jgi:hypothetical protein
MTTDEGAPCPTYPDEWEFDPLAVCFEGHRIYSHKLMRLKYTTYDVRRREDVVHVDSDVCNVMIPNENWAPGKNQPPYRYARVLGIYHADVSYAGVVAPGGVRYLSLAQAEFLWVRWYTTHPSDDSSSMPRVSFPPITDPGATAFIEPDTVLRACHVIPRFHLGKVNEEGSGLSVMGRDGSDWKEYYVNKFVSLLLSVSASWRFD